MYTYSIKGTRNINIQPITPYDFEMLMQLERRCFKTPWSEEIFRVEIEENQFAKYLMVKDHEKMIAYGGIWLIIGEAHVTNIAVHPNYRRRGIGRELMLSLMEVAIGLGADKMTLEVRKSNIGAQALYKELGFDRYGLRKAYYADTGEDAIIMWNGDIESTVQKYRRNGCGV